MVRTSNELARALLLAAAVLPLLAAACAPSRPAMDDRAEVDASKPSAHAPVVDASAELARAGDGGGDGGVGGDGGRAPASAAAPEPCLRMQLSGACTPRSFKADDALDLDAWYAARSAKRPSDAIPPSCAALRIGPDAEEALVCELLEHTSVNVPTGGPLPFALLRTVIRVVRKKRVEVVFDAPSHVDALDKLDAFSGPIFALAVDTSRAATEIVVSEPRPAACADASRSIAEQLKEAVKEAAKEKDRASRAGYENGPRADARLLGQLCAATGRYVWSKGAFRRAGALPPAPASGSSL